jgi:NADH:ubiquinone oxidoreductase subunit F (NADH-binding)
MPPPGLDASLLAIVESLQDYVAQGGGRGIGRARTLGPDAITAEVESSGLRGRGGAGFPTGTKWRAVQSGGAGRRYVVCNAAEGEPATFKDRQLLRNNPYQVLEGVAIAALAVGASQAFVGLKRSFTLETESLVKAVEEMSSAGLLEGVDVGLAHGRDEYLLGEETGLLRVIEGGDALPRVPRPFMEGLFASAATPNPTLVNNVETLANLPHILAEGAAWLRRCGTETSPGTMCFTVCGHVRREGVFELPLGEPLSRLVGELGGAGRPKAVFPGASGAVIPAAQLDTPLDFDAMRRAGTGLGAGGFFVLDEDACVVAALLQFSRFLHVESCAQCPPCKNASQEITEALERIERGVGDAGTLDLILRRAETVTDGQKCALPTGEKLLVLSVLQHFASELRDHLGRACSRERPVDFPKLVDYDEQAGRFLYDRVHAAGR